MIFVSIITAVIGFSCLGFDLPKEEVCVPVADEWKCSSCGWHSYERNDKVLLLWGSKIDI